MTLKASERKLAEDLTPALARLGFRRAHAAIYLREAESSLQRIGFSAFRDRLGKVRFSFGAGIRFPEVEKLRPEETERTRPTFGAPIHFLDEDRRYRDWLVSDDPSEWQITTSQVLEDVRRKAIPFLERYSDLEVLRATLSSSNPRDWLTLDAVSRLELLALIESVLNGRDRGIQLLENALSQMADEPPKRTQPLERLREHLLSDG